MLNIIDLTGKFDREKPCVVMLGGFDGVHLGHRRLFSRAKEYRLPVGIMTICGVKGSGIFTLKERIETFRSVGIDFVLTMDFEKIRMLTPTQFAAVLTDNLTATKFVCGDDFKFGYKASGTPEILSAATGVETCVEELIKVDGAKVSTRTIKEHLSNGDIKSANKLLGENFFLIGSVETGRKVGRTIDFPTANIPYPNDKFPLKKGVYETRVSIDGKYYKGITNFGDRPTFLDETVCTETYVDGFCGDLYGKELKVEFVRFLRDIEKFESADKLRERLEKDIGRVRAND